MCSLSRTRKSSQQSFPLIFWDGMLCMRCSTTTQTTFGVQHCSLVLEFLEIVSWWESNPCHCGANSIELTTMICNSAILISCSNTIPNSRPLFYLVMRENHWSVSFDKIFFCLIWYFEMKSGNRNWNYPPYKAI